MLMAIGLVMCKKSELGLAPFSSAPAALCDVTGFSLGATTIIFQLICAAAIFVIIRKITLKSVLTIGVAFVFGWLIDLMMPFVGTTDAFGLRLLMNVLGLTIAALGIVCIVGSDLMMPSPDALLRNISIVYKKSYPLVKNLGDGFWVVVTLIIDLAAFGRIHSIGLGTVLAVILSGRLVKLFQWMFPWLNVVKEPKL